MNARSEREASYHHTAEFAERVRLNQRELAANLKPQYDFIVCGAVRPDRSWPVVWPKILTLGCCCSKPVAATTDRKSWKQTSGPSISEAIGTGIPCPTASRCQRSLGSLIYGQGAGWWVEHQCHGLGTRA
jgi:hypothetical protein